MPKILPNGAVTYEPGRDPGGVQDSLAADVAPEATEVPADGTEAAITADGEPGDQVVQLPDGEHAEPDGPVVTVSAGVAEGTGEAPQPGEAAPEPPAAPRTPPRRPPASRA